MLHLLISGIGNACQTSETSTRLPEPQDPFRQGKIGVPQSGGVCLAKYRPAEAGTKDSGFDIHADDLPLPLHNPRQIQPIASAGLRE